MNPTTTTAVAAPSMSGASATDPVRPRLPVATVTGAPTGVQGDDQWTRDTLTGFLRSLHEQCATRQLVVDARTAWGLTLARHATCLFEHVTAATLTQQRRRRDEAGAFVRLSALPNVTISNDTHLPGILTRSDVMVVVLPSQDQRGDFRSVADLATWALTDHTPLLRIDPVRRTRAAYNWPT